MLEIFSCSSPNDTHTPHDPWGGVIRSTFNFSKHGQVVYQIKWNHECSNMKEIFCPLPDPIDGFKSSTFNFFKTSSSCISNQMESRMQQHDSKYFVALPYPPPPDPVGGVKRSNSTVAYQIKGNHTCSDPLALRIGSLGQNSTFKINLRWGYNFKTFALFYFRFGRRHIRFSEFWLN